MNALYLVTVGRQSMCMTLAEFVAMNENNAGDPTSDAVRALIPGDCAVGDDGAIAWSVECLMLSCAYTLEMIRLGLAWEGGTAEQLAWAADRGLCEWDEKRSRRRLTELGGQVLTAARAHLEECVRRVA